MCYFENQYILPVLIGDKKISLRVANAITRKFGIRSHVFGFSFSFLEKIKYRCHIYSSKSDFIIKDSLIRFSDSAEPYYTAILIMCDEESRRLVRESNELESAYICLWYKDILTDKDFREEMY